MLVPCWIFLASLPLTTELVTALQIPINNSLLVVGLGGLQGLGGLGGVVTLQANSQVTTESGKIFPDPAIAQDYED